MCLDPVDTAAVLLAAHNLTNVTSSSDQTPILSYLGIVKDRWDAVLWLVKHVVEGTAAVARQSLQPASALWQWSNDGTMRSVTEQSFSIAPPATPSWSLSLDELTADKTDDYKNDHAAIRHDFVGLLWYNLADMILACEDGVIKPEILEIIAYLHHHELMPMSIYTQKPPAAMNAIQQPPMLHLLSPQILKSLSDAAWKAQERLMSGESYRVIPSTAYRVQLEGVRPEVWLELVLWSCLQGDWLDDGLLILYRVCNCQQAWAPLSWRTLASADQAPPDWARLDRFLATDSNAATDPPDRDYAQVKRTISSEVVTAYIDTLLSIVHVEKTIGFFRFRAPEFLVAFKSFLERGNAQLKTDSWNVAILRGRESMGTKFFKGSSFSDWMRLSAPFQSKAYLPSSQTKFHAIAESSAMPLSLYHNVLLKWIELGKLKAAMEVLFQLQIFTRMPSAESWSGVSQPASSRPIRDDVALEHPASEMQIPVTILAPLLDLVTDSKAYELGSTLLKDKSSGTPIITEAMFRDPVLAAPLVRFAAETGDRDLLSRVIEATARPDPGGTSTTSVLAESVAQAFLDTQVGMGKWSAVKKLVQFMEDMRYKPSARNLANLANAMLKAYSNNQERDLQEATGIFSALMKESGSGSRPQNKMPSIRDGFRGLQIRREHRLQQYWILAILASTDPYWARFCTGIQELSGFKTFMLPANIFNILLEGILVAFGSDAGVRVLGKFWPSSARRMQTDAITDQHGPHRARKSNVMGRQERQRNVVLLPGLDDHKVVMYGGLQPNTRTILLVLRQVAEEIGSMTKLAPAPVDMPNGMATTSAPPPSLLDDPRMMRNRVTILWVTRCLKLQGLGKGSIRGELEAALPEYVTDLPRLAPRLYGAADAEGTVENHDDGGTVDEGELLWSHVAYEPASVS